MRFLLLTLILAAPQFAQKWDKVEELKSGQEVRVETAQGKQTGFFLGASADALRFQAAGGAEVSVPRADIGRVYARKKPSRLRNTLIGIGVGVGVGAVLYGTLGQLFINEGHEAGSMLAVPILIGTAAGGLWPTGGMKLVYRKDR